MVAHLAALQTLTAFTDGGANLAGRLRLAALHISGLVLTAGTSCVVAVGCWRSMHSTRSTYDVRRLLSPLLKNV